MSNSIAAPFGPSKPAAKQTNPLARALAETEREQRFNQAKPTPADPNNLFGDALARTGGSFGDYQIPNGLQNQHSEQAFLDQQRQLEAQQKKEALRRKLHDQINPVDQIDVFSAREQQVKQEIAKTRQELKGLVKEVAAFHKEIEVTLMAEVPEPGLEGKYHLTFFQKLRSFIMLLRQQIRSAQTWATQLQGKRKKQKASKFSPGMMVSGQGYEKTSAVQDMLHHERSSQYSGG